MFWRLGSSHIHGWISSCRWVLRCGQAQTKDGCLYCWTDEWMDGWLDGVIRSSLQGCEEGNEEGKNLDESGRRGHLSSWIAIGLKERRDRSRAFPCIMYGSYSLSDPDEEAGTITIYDTSCAALLPSATVARTNTRRYRTPYYYYYYSTRYLVVVSNSSRYWYEYRLQGAPASAGASPCTRQDRPGEALLPVPRSSASRVGSCPVLRRLRTTLNLNLILCLLFQEASPVWAISSTKASHQGCTDNIEVQSENTVLRT